MVMVMVVMVMAAAAAAVMVVMEVMMLVMMGGAATSGISPQSSPTTSATCSKLAISAVTTGVAITYRPCKQANIPAMWPASDI